LLIDQAETGPTLDSITYRFVNYRSLTAVVFIPLGLGGIAMLVNLLAGRGGAEGVDRRVWAWMDSNHRPADYESAALTF
jgi:hypothetical protein